MRWAAAAALVHRRFRAPGFETHATERTLNRQYSLTGWFEVDSEPFLHKSKTSGLYWCWLGKTIQTGAEPTIWVFVTNSTRSDYNQYDTSTECYFETIRIKYIVWYPGAITFNLPTTSTRSRISLWHLNRHPKSSSRIETNHHRLACARLSSAGQIQDHRNDRYAIRFASLYGSLLECWEQSDWWAAHTACSVVCETFRSKWKSMINFTRTELTQLIHQPMEHYQSI
jgi:hypothetical protein